MAFSVFTRKVQNAKNTVATAKAVANLFIGRRSLVNITADEREEFEENGVVCLRGVFSENWLKMTEKGMGRNLMSPSIHCDWLINEEDGTGLFFNDYYNFNKIPEYNVYVRESPAAQIAKEMTNSKKIGLFHEHVFYKEKGSLKETPWHHDQAYYPLNGMQNCSIWMPTRTVPKISSLKFVQGSHKWNKWFVPRLFKNNQNYTDVDTLPRQSDSNVSNIETVIKEIGSYNILQWKLEPGDCIVFHMKTIHGTSASISNNKRVVMSTRWLGDDMTYCRRPWSTSPPKKLLPNKLEIGDILVENDDFISQVHEMKERRNRMI